MDSVNVKVGDAVTRGAVLARVALPSQIGVAQNGQAKLDFLGGADTRIDVTAPIDGLVIATPAAVGADVQAGQAIVTVVDPSALWVNANVDETAIDRVRVGQPVSVHVDALGSDISGAVEAITPATASTFSLLPSNSSSGTFNKVVQQVPVRINVLLGNQPALLGTSVEVKIRVAE
ncbi:MAG: efflux RND transporter periplasmic adaptor subunit [Chloroflexi bacterium]|nr:efflux RND transporter periplasmic adaptor subunit [Chloroflexota bacterium]